MSQAERVSWTVLVNPEGQHGLYPASQPAPAGWRATGFVGDEDECAAYVDQHWTDMRPQTLRRAMGVDVGAGSER